MGKFITCQCQASSAWHVPKKILKSVHFHRVIKGGGGVAKGVGIFWEPGFASFIGVKDNGSGGDNWSYKACKLQWPTANQHATFYRPDALPVAQPTVWKHWRESPQRLHYIILFFLLQNELYVFGGSFADDMAPLWMINVGKYLAKPSFCFSVLESEVLCTLWHDCCCTYVVCR